jgi:hypothetical protein
MEIINTANIDNIILSVDQTFNISENKFITIKEMFIIDNEIYISYINERIPYVNYLENIGIEYKHYRVIMLAKNFILLNSNLFNQ